MAVWGDYVSFPPNMTVREDDEFLPLVVCPNPDHHTEKRHFQINVDKPLVHCFANCGISGTYEHAISMIEGITKRESRKRILKHSRIGKVKKRKRSSGSTQAISPAALSYERYVPPFGMEYLMGRGISGESISRWEIGWDSNERRIVIPVKDSRNRTRLLIRRAVREKDHPKYLYTEGVTDRNHLLFGTCEIDLGMIRSEGVILVEGSFDCIVMHQHGFRNTVATMGSHLSEIQAQQIMNMRPKRVVTMFDADGSGISATMSVLKLIQKTPIRIVRYPKGHTDPAMLSKEQAERAIRRAISSTDFLARTKLIRRSRSTTSKERIEVG